MEDNKEVQDPTYIEAAKQAIRRKIKEDAPKQARLYDATGQPHARKLLKIIDEIDKDPKVLSDESGENMEEIAVKVTNKPQE